MSKESYLQKVVLMESVETDSGSSSLLISGKVEITADNTVKKALPIRNWGRVHVELSIMYPGRLSHFG